MKLPEIRGNLPSWPSIVLAVAAAVVLVLAFPDFEYWFLAWFALVPLLWAIDREKGSIVRSFMLGWLFGTAFFFGTCWWLTFAPITYAGFPPALAYFLLLVVCSIVAIFPAIFAGVMAFLLQRSGGIAILTAPFVWVCTEFARYWITGNNWNAIGYSQSSFLISPASLGGVYLVGFFPVANAAWAYWSFHKWHRAGRLLPSLFFIVSSASMMAFAELTRSDPPSTPAAAIIALQPNVPMSGLSNEKWQQLRHKHVEMAESALERLDEQRSASGEESEPGQRPPTTVVFPESPMNFQYTEDREFQSFINDFARRNNVSVLFNSAEPNHADGKYFNSAVIVGSDGRMLGQYDKIYLVPFGESVPAPLQSIVPAFVGSFSIGNEYDLLPVGEVKAGVMICFESHFGQLSRQYVANGADVIIEMTNDGYLGPTPVLRQHLANAVFRAVETNRPVLRVTNVGITAYINERGEVLDAAESYVEDTRVWTVAKSDGSQTFYVKYGDWFAWLCSALIMVLLGIAVLRSRPIEDLVKNSS
jgi:apolipoprotein N-acyltransferase